MSNMSHIPVKDHLSRDEMQQYIAGKLRHHDVVQIEAHLSQCDFCNEAVKGLKSSQNDLRLASIRKEIFNKTFRKHGNTKLRFGKNSFSLLVLITAVSLLLMLFIILLYVMKVF